MDFVVGEERATDFPPLTANHGTDFITIGAVIWNCLELLLTSIVPDIPFHHVMLCTFPQNFESYHPIAKKLVFHPGGFLNTWQFFDLIYQGKYALIGT